MPRKADPQFETKNDRRKDRTELFNEERWPSQQGYVMGKPQGPACGRRICVQTRWVFLELSSGNSSTVSIECLLSGEFSSTLPGRSARVVGCT